MNALLVNRYTQRWAAIGAALPKPKAILCRCYACHGWPLSQGCRIQKATSDVRMNKQGLLARLGRAADPHHGFLPLIQEKRQHVQQFYLPSSAR